MKFEKIYKLLLVSAVFSTLFMSCDLYNIIFEEDNEKQYFVLKKDEGRLKDIDGNVYKTIKLGSQWWMAENLRTTTYADGTKIPYVPKAEKWAALSETDFAYCFYNNNDSLYKYMYGGLYTWATVVRGEIKADSIPSGIQGICPDGWHVPSYSEWEKLVNAVLKDIDNNAGGNALKALNFSGGKDYYGFSALAGGFRYLDGSYNDIGLQGFWWHSTEYSENLAYHTDIYGSQNDVVLHYQKKTHAISVRCVKD